MRIGLIGAGTMGANHARVVAGSTRAILDVVVDVDQSRADKIAESYGARSATDPREALECDAVLLCTPTDAHVEGALQIMDAGVPLLIEKPVALEFTEVQRICQIATDRGLALACGFVERFNPVISLARSLLDDPPVHLVALRHSPADPRNLGSVVHDLLIHDVDLALQLMGSEAVRTVVGASWSPPGGKYPEIADCTVTFDNGALVSLSASRMGQRKLRSIQVLTQSLLLDLDLLRADVTVYRNVLQEQPEDPRALTYRAQTIIDIPFVRHSGEPLALQLDHFLDLVDGSADREQEVTSILASHALASKVAQQCVGVQNLVLLT
ncbi:MAG TPA: Gfo/Idh/MocA family oxidoreductase [Acidimicrobiales bacterium]|nr:Gfo/Idh/MocA family oxidoreductase [Acidimicrobiales bacterium]